MVAEPKQVKLIKITRSPVADTGPCDACGANGFKLLLCLEMEKNMLILCPMCEGELLARLLNNWVKRKQKGLLNPWTGTLLKEEEDLLLDAEDEEEEDEELEASFLEGCREPICD